MTELQASWSEQALIDARLDHAKQPTNPLPPRSDIATSQTANGN